MGALNGFPVSTGDGGVGYFARGATDDWYTAKKLDADMSALRARGEDPEAFTHDGGHEWTGEVAMAAGNFLAHWDGLKRR